MKKTNVTRPLCLPIGCEANVTPLPLSPYRWKVLRQGLCGDTAREWGASQPALAAGVAITILTATIHHPLISNHLNSTDQTVSFRNIPQTFSRNIPIALRYDVMNSGSTVFCEQPFHVWLYKGPLGRPGRHFTSASSACMKIFIFIHASISTSFLQLTTASMYWYCFYSSCSDNTLRISLYEDLNENWASCCSGRNGVLLGNPKKWDVCEEVSCSEVLQLQP